MKQILILKQIPCDLNTYIQKERSNKYLGAKIKREETELIAWECKRQALKKINHPVIINYLWVVVNKRKDKDNIAFAKKFIQDGLVMAGILKNDGWNDITGFSDSFKLGKEEKVEIEIIWTSG
jgi:hypothetical protein